MRTVLNIALVLAGILISVMAPSSKTVAVTQPKSETHNMPVVYGLHIALPDGMKAFPAELVPEP